MDPSLSVSCVSATTATTPIERGTEAVCRVTLSNGVSAPIASLRTIPSDPNANWFSAAPTFPALSTPYEWRGIAVAAGTVKVEVTYAGRAKTASAQLAVSPRVWVPPAMPSPSVTVGLGPNMTSYPATGGWYGANDLYITWADGAVFGGPNDGVWYLTGQLALVDEIWIHPALTPSTATGQALAWYNDQNGFPAATCGPSQIAALHAEVRRHEGATLDPANSHWGHWASSLQLPSFATAVGQIEQVAAGQQTLLRPRVVAASINWYNPQDQAERAWDLQERQAILGINGLLACNIDNVLVGDGG